MGLSTPEGIREFQRKLYSKSKEEPDFRFYSLMDKITHPGVLKMAYRKCRESDKAPGVDGRMLTRFLDGSLTDSWMEVYEKLRRKILGWVSYYRHGSKYDAFKEINNHLYQRLKNYFRRTGREFGGGLSSSVTYFVKECLDPFKWARKLDDNSVSDLL